VLIITYGGHGGDKCSDALRLVFEGGVKAQVVEPRVLVTLPSEYIRHDDTRVTPASRPEFLKAYEDELIKAIDATLDAAALHVA
jgi:hypothetical protein